MKCIVFQPGDGIKDNDVVAAQCGNHRVVSQSCGRALQARLRWDGSRVTEEGVTVEEWPEMDVFVVSYSGWSSGEREERYADRLKGMLERDGRDYNDSVVIAASYDSPMTFFGRHNEVWLLKLDDGPATGAAAAGSGELLSTSAVEGELTNTTLLDELSGGAPNSTLSE